MAKTYIQLINDVGKHLRLSDGTTFTTLTNDQDVIFIAAIINLAKDMVEGERQWDAMRLDIDFPSVVDTQTYDTSDLNIVTTDPDVTNERSQILANKDGQVQFWDITDSEFRLERRTRSWVKHQNRLSGDVDQNKPGRFAIYHKGNGLTVEFPFNVSAVRNYSFQVYNPQDELASTSTVISAPWRPVVLAATAMAAEERGEELGMEASTWWGRYNSALSQAIVIDMFSAEDATLVAS